MKKIIKSAFLVVAIAAVAGYATYSFFSDTETSTGNTFTAGAIDLKVDNHSYAIDYNIPNYPSPIGALVASPGTTWELDNLQDGNGATIHKFFDFVDLKPGDVGEDTISFHVDSNPAWVCAEIEMKTNKDNTCTEPEKVEDTSCTDPDGVGELASQINFIWWADDGDNVYEDNEHAFFLAPESIAALMNHGTTANPDNDKLELTLADTHINFTNGLSNSPLSATQTYYVGKGWCFGNMVATPVAHGDYPQGPLTPVTSGGTIGTGFTCDGLGVNNAAQTDSLTADLKFTAIQSRNNMNFHCPDDFHPAP